MHLSCASAKELAQYQAHSFNSLLQLKFFNYEN